MDIERPTELSTYLRQKTLIVYDEDISMQLLPGGVSNRTVLVTRPNGEQWVIKQALHKLRVKADWFSDPVRIHREAQALHCLGSLAPNGSVPELVFDDADLHVIAMRAVQQPHENWKSMLLRGQIVMQHVAQFAEWLGIVHRDAPAHPELKKVFSDRTFFESLRLEPYYRFTASKLPESAMFLNRLIEDTLAHCDTWVHGDFSPKNVLVHQDKLVILDYEVVHWGDPAFDVGFAMTHLLSKAHHLTQHRNAFVSAAQQFWQIYSQHVEGLYGDLEKRATRHTLACLLARVDGRSPLEYLTDGERLRQRAGVLQLMHNTPVDMSALIQQFSTHLANT